MRQIVLDTETTGLYTEHGHRIIEIGCVELVDRQLTGNNLHHYINPERDIEAEALAVHGISSDFLAGKPKFADIVQEFIAFINGAEIIAHNASFDVGFINYEMQRLAKNSKTLTDYATVFDSLALARKLYPGQKNNLDALCKRLQIDLRTRTLHGALLDATLLAQAYLLMTGGQTSLFKDSHNERAQTTNKKSSITTPSKKRKLLIAHANQDELKTHQEFLAKLQKISGKILWEDN